MTPQDPDGQGTAVHDTAVLDTAVLDTPVGTVQQVLGALQDPIRLEMVRRLRNADDCVRCGELYDGINKSTATHHFKILREAGVIERLTVDGQVHQRLRRDEVEKALPGLIDSVVAAANRETAE